MSEEHARMRLLLGAYVLGALDPAERNEVGAHVQDCLACRDELASFAAVPAMLHRVRSLPGSAAVPPPLLGPLVERTIRARARQRRRRMAVGLAAGTLVVAAGLSAVLSALPDKPPDPAYDLAITDGTGAASAGLGRIQLIGKPWGTQVVLQASGLPVRGRLAMWVIARDGRSEPAATWGPTPTGTVKVDGASSIAVGQVTEVEIRTEDGDVLLRAEVP